LEWLITNGAAGTSQTAAALPADNTAESTCQTAAALNAIISAVNTRRIAIAASAAILEVSTPQIVAVINAGNTASPESSGGTSQWPSDPRRAARHGKTVTQSLSPSWNGASIG
jgi:hypothetical protein